MDRATVFFVSCLLTVCSGTPLAWERLPATGALLQSRWFAGSVVYNGGLYVFGGQGSRSVVNTNGTGSETFGDIWRYDLTTTTWMEISPPPTSPSPSPRFGFVGGLVENMWIVSHGCDETRCFSDTWALNLDTFVWSQLINSTSLTSSYPEARFTTAGGVYPGSSELWLSMGETTTARKLSDTWILRVDVNTTSASWELVNAGGGLNQYHPLQPHARSLHAGIPISPDTFTIYGGCASGGQVGGPCPLQDSWTINLSDRKWVEFPRCPTPRTRHTMVTIGANRSVLVGGSQIWGPGIFPQPLSTDQNNSTDVYVMTFDPNSSQNQTHWKRVFVSGEVPARLDGASLVYDPATGVVYLFGGQLSDRPSVEYEKTIWRLTGNGEGDAGLPCPAPQFSYVHLHGVFMYVAWGLLLPLGALLGRYYKWAWPCWFVLHIICQSIGVLFTVAGFVVIFLVGSYSEPTFAHAIIGIILTALLIQQYLSGIFHPCVDKEDGKTHKDDKSVFRKCWEVYHTVSGFITVAVGIGQLTLGVFLVVAPLEVWSVWCALGGLWVVVFLIHECGFLCYRICNRNRDIE